MELQVRDIIETSAALAPSTGQKLHDEITRFLDRRETIILNFSGMLIMTTAFFNAAIGRLYSEYPTELLQSNLKIVNLEQDDAVFLKKVVDSAKLYFNNKDIYSNRIKDHLDGE